MGEDTISRQAAIDVVDDLKACVSVDGYWAWMERLKKLPSAEPRWIPVTERLPKEKQDVLLAFRHNMVVGFWEDILNDGGQAWYANSGNGWFTGTESVDDDGIPIAWMPLPTPWKGEADE